MYLICFAGVTPPLEAVTRGSVATAEHRRKGLDKVAEVNINEPTSSHSGLPATGPGSPASWSRRFAALIIDWIMANVAAFIIVGGQAWEVGSGATWLPLVCWFGLVWLSTAFTGASLGQWMMRIRIIRMSGGRVGVFPAAARTALILLVIPPLVFDKDQRGLHDLAANTAAVNAPRNARPA